MALIKKIAAAAAVSALAFSTFVAFGAGENAPKQKQNASAQTESVPTLRVGSLTVYAPFEYMDSATGQYEGFDMDLVRELGKREGYKIEIVSMTLDGLIPALMADNIDVAVSALTITPERSEKVDFTKPYINAGLTVMTTRDNAPKIKSLKDLEGKCLCAEIGSSGALFMKRIPGTTIRTFNSAADAFLELNKNGCYAMLNDGPVNKYFLRQDAAKSMNLVALDWVVSDDQYGFAVKKGNAELLKKLDDALDAMKKDGTYDRIYDKWFGDTGENIKAN
ncbi:MAG: basic amino acid ABC transporter substrate-binding protein [Sutterella sp.]|nr:basic amino acid ABC transporter substrate-binding protein [Sutterella sp.]